MKNQPKKKQGFTLIEIMIVVVIIAVLASVAIPAYVNGQATAKQATALQNAQAIKAVYNRSICEGPAISTMDLLYNSIQGGLPALTVGDVTPPDTVTLTNVAGMATAELAETLYPALY